ncbi:sortase [Patescibacteria group bacterium]|nr:sortase [Patescibacteria group bacterium]
MEQKSTNNFLGCLPKAVFLNLLIGAAALLLGILLGGPKIYISLTSAIITFCFLLILYIAITWWSIWALAKAGKNGTFVATGPYALTRNPMYAAIIFILNPALGILFRSWLLILAVLPIYFFWRICVRNEETNALATKFGQAYSDYMKTTPRFFPNLRKINRILFYGAAGILIFLISFISLNSSALYLRWVVWETNGEITYDKPVPNKALFPSLSMSETADLSNQSALTFEDVYPANPSLPIAETRAASYNDSPDSIIISRLDIHTPLVMASGTTQGQLNEALNQGAILYPGSALPGQAGEVVISGHSSVFPWVKTQYGQVFTLLDKLQVGDTVSLVYNHRQYDYQITGQEVLNPNQVKIFETDQPLLKMITCWPIGTSAKRLVVYGELIK